MHIANATTVPHAQPKDLIFKAPAQRPEMLELHVKHSEVGVPPDSDRQTRLTGVLQCASVTLITVELGRAQESYRRPGRSAALSWEHSLGPCFPSSKNF